MGYRLCSDNIRDMRDSESGLKTTPLNWAWLSAAVGSGGIGNSGRGQITTPTSAPELLAGSWTLDKTR